jgi:hypothetical protein
VSSSFLHLLLGNLCNQSYILPVNTFNSLVANGDFMGVTSKIFHHRFGTSKVWPYLNTNKYEKTYFNASFLLYLKHNKTVFLQTDVTGHSSADSGEFKNLTQFLTYIIL